MIGTTVGHFRVVGYLGRGASGTVYRAVDEILHRDVALKVLNPEQIDRDAVTRFRAEATTLAKLNHPGIATIYEMLESDGQLAMAMECARGETLDHLSERLGPLPPERAIDLTERILAALDHAHRAGILHCDLKPANVMVSDGELKITDFGIAQMLGEQRAGGEGMLGTPAYMAPEQVLGQPLDARTDLYAVGVILYRLFTGTLPFDSDLPALVLRRQVSDAPPPLHTRREGLPPWCESIVQRALAKPKAERFQTADEFRDALTSAAAAASAAPVRRAGRFGRTYRLVAAVSAATAVGLLAYGGVQRIPITPLPATASESRISEAPAPSIESPAGNAAVAASPSPEALKSLRESGAYKPETPLPRLEFDAKALVADRGKAQERSARLVLAERTLIVLDGEAGRALHSLPYESITSINYSHSHDPLWASPAGPTPIIRARGMLRTLGFAVNRDWVSLITKTSIRFVVLRIADSDVTHVLSALQDRTHRTVLRLEPKRESDRRSIL